jgi:plasmid stabilization system protein ParE
MAEVRWTIQAADDLDAIVHFIATDSEHYARLLASESLGCDIHN